MNEQKEGRARREIVKNWPGPHYKGQQTVMAFQSLKVRGLLFNLALV